MSAQDALWRETETPPTRVLLLTFSHRETWKSVNKHPQTPWPSASPQSPPTRDYTELFATGDVTTPRDASPVKENANPLKSGAGKHYGQMRLFEEEPTATSPERGIKTYTKKYQHFEFGEPSIPTATPVKPSKHSSQWDFTDFTTPHKVAPRRQVQTTRNALWGELEADPAMPEVHLEHKLHARPDASSHFAVGDDPADQKPQAARPSTSDSHGLYDEHITIADDDKTPMPLGNITNVTAHRKTFSSSFDVEDKSPDAKDENAAKAKAKPTTFQNSAKTLQSSWSLYDDSPVQERERGIKIAGNGMGNRTGSDMWEF